VVAAVGYEIISNRDNIKVVKIYGVLSTRKEYGGISRVNIARLQSEIRDLQAQLWTRETISKVWNI
jgi:hypothetical protein